MIIGITGTDGAGKGVVVDYLVKNKGFSHYSARDLIVAEIEKRGLEVSRSNTRLVANDMRKIDRAFMVNAYLPVIKEQRVDKAIIESIRTLSEVEALHKAGGILLAVDANQELRFWRIKQRASETDNVSFEQFKEQEALEMNDPDPNGMQKAKVMEMADHTIMNDGTLAELHQKIEVILKELVEAEK